MRLYTTDELNIAKSALMGTGPEIVAIEDGQQATILENSVLIRDHVDSAPSDPEYHRRKCFMLIAFGMRLQRTLDNLRPQ